MTEISKIRVTGKDRVTVLHNILTNDIKNIPIGKSVPTALLSAQGKIKMFMEVHVLETWILLIVEPGFAEKTISFIDQFIISEDVALEDISDSYQFPASLTPQFIFPKDQASEIYRIENGIPRYGVDMDENTTFSETGLDKIAVSWTKGCYPGQEVVARLDTYGGLHRKIRGFIFEARELPKAGDKIYSLTPSFILPRKTGEERGEGKEIGEITSAAVSKKLQKGIALGYLAKGYFEKNIPVRIASEGNFIEARTSGFPLVTRDGDDIQERSS